MLSRDIQSEFKTLINEYPVVTILGPRQSGKTTLAKKSLPEYEYSNLEDPGEREFAESDPVAFLNQFKGSVILDEIQRVPILLSYIQVRVDKHKVNGEFVLTGSHQLELNAAITQSLAGRTAIIKLLPFSIHELKQADIFFDHFKDYCFQGFLPRIYDQNQRPQKAYANYYQTYVERDVRLLIQLKNVSLFEKFIKLLAGRAGQLINYQSLANDVGVDQSTIKHWLSILEASFIIFKLPPYFENFGKRQTKNPKYYFMDTGLLVYLLDISNPSQITRDPLVGNIFENLVVMDCLKNILNKGDMGNIYFYRDSNGTEVDLLFQHQGKLVAIEIKSSATFHASQFNNIEKLQKISSQNIKACVVYSGKSKNFSSGKSLLNFTKLHSLFE